MQFPTHQASKTPVTPRGQAPGANLSSFKRVSSYACKNLANGISWQKYFIADFLHERHC